MTLAAIGQQLGKKALEEANLARIFVTYMAW
jgi:hypothetical protein